MGKRLMPGKTTKSKGKKLSHRPVRQTEAVWDERLRKWFKAPGIALFAVLFALQPLQASDIAYDDNTIGMLNKRDDGEKMVYSHDIKYINVGDTVTWVPISKGHNVQYVVGPEDFGKSKLSKEFSYTFTEEGTYVYICTPHKSMGMVAILVVGGKVEQSRIDEALKKVKGKSKKKLNKLQQQLF